MLTSWKAGSYRLYSPYYWLRRRSNAHDERALRDWRLLEEGFGRPVADAFRNGLRHLWRQAKPRGPQRGEGGRITYFKENELAFGAIGVEAAENIEWAGKLSAAEVRQAARHGTLSDIRYPEWIDDLLGAFPQIVVPILKKQLREEWARAALSPLYFINHYASPVARISPALQKAFVEIILAEEAGALAGLNSAVEIVRKLDVDDAQRSALLAMARKRMQSYRRRNSEYGLRYLAVLLLLDIDTSAKYLTAWIERGDRKTQQLRAEEAFTALFGRDSALAAGSLKSASIATLENFLLLAYRHIAMADDEVHEGSYSPGQRDHAEQARNAILSAVINRAGADAYRLLQRASGHASFALRAERFRELARGKAERDAEITPWTASDVLVFEREHSAPVKTGHDLFGVVLATLRDVAFRLDHGDATSRALLAGALNEDEVQNWLAEQINLMSKGRYHAHREAQVADARKPDVIVSSTSAPVEVAIEIKHGDKGWSVKDLEDAVAKQLAITYLKPETRRHGVLVVTNHRDRVWINPETRKQMRFSELIDRLSRLAQSIVHNGIGSVEIECIGIDAWSGRGQVPPRPRQKRAASAPAGSHARGKPVARKAANTRNAQNSTGRKKK